MEAINVRLYHGGDFVTKKWKTTYEGGDISLHLNEEEVCYFEIVGWLRDLGYIEPDKIWFRRHGYSLFSGRKEMKNDKDIAKFLGSPEKDGYFHLYVVHEKEKESNEPQTGVESGGQTNESTNNESTSMLGGPPPHLAFENLQLHTKDSSSKNLKPAKNKSKTPLQPSPNKHIPKTRSKTNTNPQTQSNQPENPEAVESDTPPNSDNSNECFEENSDESDSDVVLSDGDYEDKSDDDLFNAYVDIDLSEKVIRSLGGLVSSQETKRWEVEQGERSGELVGSEGQEDILVGEDEVLNDSDEELHTPPNSDNEEDDPYKTFNPEVDFKGQIVLSKGQKFPSIKVFRKAIQYHAIQVQRDYYYLHNCSTRATVYCMNRCVCEWIKGKGKRGECVCNSKSKCRFKVHCREMKVGGTFQIKSLRPNHTCPAHSTNTKVTAQYLAERYLEDWRDNPSWLLSAFQKKCKRDLGVEVEYHKCYYARQRAFYMIYGDASEEYKRVWDYAETIKKHIPGSSVFVKVDRVDKPPTIFQRMYMCLQPCKEGFMAGCRPMLGLDGCHLKGPFPGMLLAAVGKDGNNNIFPVVLACVEVENLETWTWFLNLLTEDLGSVADAITFMLHREEPVSYMSDRQKGLLDAFKTVVPNAETRFCCRHLWANFKLKFPGEVYKQHFWKAARATTKHQFTCAMESIKLLSIDVYKWLLSIPASQWSRHVFSTNSKSGMLLNNCCESFNSVIREARTKPILSMMEWIRRWMMKRWCQKREGLHKFAGVIMPSILKMVEKQREYIKMCDVSQADVWQFEVDHEGETYVVDLEKKTCDCNRWNLLGIPCCHAVACLEKKKMHYEEFIHEAYHVKAYATTYAPSFHPIPGHNRWEKTGKDQPMPPPIRILPGRPSQKKRKKVKGEGKGKQVKDKRQNRCSKCQGVGHNKTKCKNPAVAKEIPPKKKGGRPKSTDPVVINSEKRKNRKRKRVGDLVQGQEHYASQIQASQASCTTIN